MHSRSDLGFGPLGPAAMSRYCCLYTERRGHDCVYTVVDFLGGIIVQTSSRSVADRYWLWAQKGHTARSLWILSQGPAAVARCLAKNR